MNDANHFRSLVMSAGGDAFIGLTAFFIALLVATSFSPESTTQMRQDTPSAAEQTVAKIDVTLGGATTSVPVPDRPGIAHVVLRSTGRPQVRFGQDVSAVDTDRVASHLDEVGAREVIIYSDADAPTGNFLHVMDQIRATNPELPIAIATIKQ